MSVALKDDKIALAGACGVEEAEMLVALIQENPHAAVDVSEAGVVHTALWQVLMALAPPMSGETRDPFIRNWIMPRVLTRS
jgi:hypothetical protein